MPYFFRYLLLSFRYAFIFLIRLLRLAAIATPLRLWRCWACQLFRCCRYCSYGALRFHAFCHATPCYIALMLLLRVVIMSYYYWCYYYATLILIFCCWCFMRCWCRCHFLHACLIIAYDADATLRHAITPIFVWCHVHRCSAAQRVIRCKSAMPYDMLMIHRWYGLPRAAAPCYAAPPLIRDDDISLLFAAWCSYRLMFYARCCLLIFRREHARVDTALWVDLPVILPLMRVCLRVTRDNAIELPDAVALRCLLRRLPDCRHIIYVCYFSPVALICWCPRIDIADYWWVRRLLLFYGLMPRFICALICRPCLHVDSTVRLLMTHTIVCWLRPLWARDAYDIRLFRYLFCLFCPWRAFAAAISRYPGALLAPYVASTRRLICVTRYWCYLRAPDCRFLWGRSAAAQRGVVFADEE